METDLDWLLCRRATEQWLELMFGGTMAKWPVQACMEMTLTATRHFAIT